MARVATAPMEIAAAQHRPARRAAPLLLLAGIVAAGIGLRVWQIAERSLWFDEAFCWRVVQFPFPQVVERAAADTHPPLYFLLLKAWTLPFGDSPAAMRLFSTLCGAAAIVGMYLFCVEAYKQSQGRRVKESKSGQVDAGGTPALQLGGRSAAQSATGIALLTAALVAVSVFQIRWSREVRMYALGTALAAFSHWLLIRAVNRGRRRVLPWTGYAIVTLAFTYTHHYALLSIAAQFVFLAGYLVACVGDRGIAGARGLIRGAATAGGILMLGWLPWAAVFLQQNERVQDVFWLAPFSLSEVPIAVGQMFVHPNHLEPTPAASLALAITLGLLLLSLLYKASAGDALILCAVVIPIDLAALVSTFGQSIFYSRYLIFAHLFILAAIARVVCRIPWKGARRFAAGTVLTAGLVVTAVCWPVLSGGNGPGARAVVEFLKQVHRPGEPIIVRGGVYYFPCLYYSTDQQDWQLYKAADEPEWMAGGAAAVDRERITRQQLAGLTSERLWTVSARQTMWGNLIVPVPQSWAPTGRVKEFPAVYRPLGRYVVAEYRRRE